MLCRRIDAVRPILVDDTLFEGPFALGMYKGGRTSAMMRPMVTHRSLMGSNDDIINPEESRTWTGRVCQRLVLEGQSEHVLTRFIR